MPKRDDTVRITVVIPRTMLTALRAAARREHRPYSGIIRQALEEYLGIPDTVRLGGLFDKSDEESQVAGVPANGR